MIPLTAVARAQVADLVHYYRREERSDAVRHLLAALEAVSTTIGDAPGAGLSAPRPYPELTRLNLRWLKRGRYWFAYTTDVPAITFVFFDTADIPNRVG